ncbi:YbfB/YjiJ family MFS transporter [Pokkaliibacter sp. MBI-7]|uniref:YbfB/YjiJ family MFS transporter n=1 Tax=Pokkaliibacter sp. MBI-7 TaxID=3040600 RepID=UPI00244ABF1E|nr:YbfB/YjiJ family MFS transporter [Pokkaliibacter sp. MBI-7]MDH2431386.1 YbfB/YjiJ family MFS transporter [Pokkaliibacter sp. MBI-7]
MAYSTQAWKVVFAGICSLILTVGLARFAYTPMLAVMRDQTWLTEVAGGWLATFNYAGYMSGALLAATIKRLDIKFQLYRLGLLAALLSTAAMGMTDNVITWGILRYISGMSSVAGLLISSGLVLNWLLQHNQRLELGIHFAGMGLGIVVSGLAVAALLPLLHWGELWLALGVLGIVFFIPAWSWMPMPVTLDSRQHQQTSAAPERRWMLLMIASYFCAGFGYVISATFIVEMAEQPSAQVGSGSLIWIVVGLAATPAAFIWDQLNRRLGDIPTLMLAYLLQIISIMLPVFSQSLPAYLLCAVLYGVTFMGIVSLTLTLIGRCYPANPAKAMARLTLSYGAAQIIAPAITGYIAAATGQYSGALWMAAAMMTLGIGLLVMLHRVSPLHTGASIVRTSQ